VSCAKVLVGFVVHHLLLLLSLPLTLLGFLIDIPIRFNCFNLFGFGFQCCFIVAQCYFRCQELDLSPEFIISSQNYLDFSFDYRYRSLLEFILLQLHHYP